MDRAQRAKFYGNIAMPRITFADLKLGDKFILLSEDNPDLKTEGVIIEIYDSGNGYRSVLFDDELGNFTRGKYEDPIYDFMRPC